MPSRGRAKDFLFRVARMFVLAFAMLLASRGMAFAHAALLKSDPVAGSRLAASPSRIWLLFSEEMEASLASITLTASDGRVITLKCTGDPHDVHAIVGRVDGLPNGEYVVQWHAVSADGHPIAGNFKFAVAVAMTAVPAPMPAPAAHVMEDMTWGPAVLDAPLVPAILRGLAMAALMALSGLLFFMAREEPRHRALHVQAARAIRWSAFLSLAFLMLHACAWMMNAIPDHHATSEMLVAVLHTGTGRMEMWRCALALLSLCAFVFAGQVRLATLAAFAALVVSGTSGHSAAITPVVATPAKALHLIAGAVWIGGLLWLLLLDRTDRARFLVWTARVSQLALVAVIVVAFSGIVQTLLFLPSLAAVFSSAYGAVALAKLAGLLVLVGFGAYHRYGVLPAMQQHAESAGQFSKTLRLEMAVMFGVIMLGGLLAYMPPPHIDSPSPSHSSVP